MPTKLEAEITAGRFQAADGMPCTYANEDCTLNMAWVERENDEKWHNCMPICSFHEKNRTLLSDHINAEDRRGR